MSDFISRQQQISPIRLTNLPDELQTDILLRLPLHHHSLRQASQVCRLWRHLIRDQDFLGPFRARHNGIPPLIGVFHNNCFSCNQRFTPTSEDRSASSIFQFRASWRILDCRHGRVLFLRCCAGLPVLVVWDPMIARFHQISMPPNLMVYDYGKLNGVIVCTASDNAEGHHGDCRSSPFLVVLLIGREPRARVSIYSSVAAGDWSEVITYDGLPAWANVCPEPCVVIGNTLYRPLLAISHPPETKWMDVRIMKLDGTTLCLVVADNAAFNLHFWERKDATGDWVLRQTVKLDTLQPVSAATPAWTGNLRSSIKLLGACEYGNAIFVGIRSDTFLFYLDSMQLTKLSVCHAVSMGTLSPNESFYAPRSWPHV